MTIRRVRVDELERLREIELEAGRAFAEIGMAEIADDEPLSVEELSEFLSVGRAWVGVVDGCTTPVAYLLGSVVDGAAHVEQVSVAPAARGQALGAALINHLSGVARLEGREWVTLTTFRDVPWNAPYYERLGFAVMGSVDVGPELAALMEAEATEIPGDAPRVAMRRAI